MLLRVNNHNHNAQKETGEDDEEVGGLVGSGGGHAERHGEEKAEGCHVDGQKFPRFSSTPKLPNQDSLAK